jgi:hypothetical protein
MYKVSRIRSRLGSRLAGLAVLGLLATMLAAPVEAQAPPIVRVRPDPLTLGLRAGEQGVMAIRVESVESLYGAEIHLTFDPAMLEVVDADAAAPGIQVKPGDLLKDGFAAVNKADNAAGKIDFAATLLNPAMPVSGSGNVATVTFRAKANGSSALKIVSALLASKDAKEIKSAWQDGAVTVSAGGQAPQAPTMAAAPAPTGVPVGIEAAAPAGETTKPSQVVMTALAGAGVLLFLAALIFVVGVVKRRA